MRAAGYGRILTLASAPGLAGAAARSGYAASTGAAAQLTRTPGRRAARHRDHRRRPGPRPVPPRLNAGTGDDPQARRFPATEIPAGRRAEPGEITGPALLLTDPASSYLTGAIVPADGDWTAH